ncbi:MAG: PUA domain-containing protein [Methanobacteriota archaeon]
MPPGRRYRLRKDELKSLVQEAKVKFGEAIAGVIDKDFEILEPETGIELIIGGGKAIFFRKNGELLPTLNIVDVIKLRSVVVDMGAVPYVVNGADVMGPGVVSADSEINVGDVVTVVDERHGKSLAIGTALLSGKEMKTPKGKAVKNMHHVGDKIWQLLEKS